MLPLGAIRGQSPAPIVIKAISPATAATPSPKPLVEPDTSTSQSAIKLLEQVKAANQETLKRQQAVLEQLDELQKAAEQMKIFTKRG